MRAEIAGWHGLFAMDPPVPGLVPEKVSHWQVQQRRWSNGFVQVARKLFGEVWMANWPWWRKLSASFLILIQMFYPCVALGSPLHGSMRDHPGWRSRPLSADHRNDCGIGHNHRHWYDAHALHYFAAGLALALSRDARFADPAAALCQRLQRAVHSKDRFRGRRRPGSARPRRSPLRTFRRQDQLNEV